MEMEKENKLSSLSIKDIGEQSEFTVTIYGGPTVSGIFSNFENFLPSVYKFGMVYTLVFGCYGICSDWTHFLKGIFRKNVYLENFIYECREKVFR